MRAVQRWQGGFRLRSLPALLPARGGPRQTPQEGLADRGPWLPRTDLAPGLPYGLKTLDFVLLCLVALFGLLLLSVPLWG